jgi:hypothetical protein
MSNAREKKLWQEKHAQDYQVYCNLCLSHAQAVILSYAALGGRGDELPPPEKSIMFLSTYPKHPEDDPIIRLYSPERHTMVTESELAEIARQFTEFREKCPEALIPLHATKSATEPDAVWVSCKRAGYLDAPNERARNLTYLHIPDDRQEFTLPADEWFGRDLKKLWTITEDGQLAEGEAEVEDNSPSP